MIPARATLTDLGNLGVASARISTVADDKKQANLDVASDLIDGYLSRQYPLPLAAPYPRDIIKAECIIAAIEILDNIGWNPQSPAEVAIKNKYDWLISVWLPGVAKGDIGPNIVGFDAEADDPSGPEVITSTSRGYSERGMSHISPPSVQTNAFSDD